MLNKTQIANNALAYLSASSIQSIDEDTNERSRVIKSVFDQVAVEVIRSHRWSCCIKRATLSRLAETPTKSRNFGYSHSFQLPSDCLRFLDLNGEPYKPKTTQLDINGRVLFTNDSTANIRYVAWEQDTTLWDVLLAKAVSVALAGRIARRITKDGMSSEQFVQLYAKVLADAQKVDALEVGSGENNPIEQILESSPLVQVGRTGVSNSRASVIGLNIDYSEPR